jgi:ATP-dependent Clp protease ATP-binding subunit ClpX
VGLSEVIKSRIKGTSIGFGASLAKTHDEADLSAVTPDDLTKFGMIPEFVGRFTTAVSLTDLNEEQLLRVLTDIKNNYIDQYKYLFSLDEVELEFDNSALKQLVTNCLTLKTGARGLHTEIERALMPHMFNVKKYQRTGLVKVNINKELVLEPKEMLP